jgi:hypothetical protein
MHKTKAAARRYSLATCATHARTCAFLYFIYLFIYLFESACVIKNNLQNITPRPNNASNFLLSMINKRAGCFRHVCRPRVLFLLFALRHGHGPCPLARHAHTRTCG